MFGGLGAGNKVVMPLEHFRTVRVKVIVDCHGKTGFFEHGGQGRSRTRTEIEPPGAGGKPIAQGFQQAREETPVTPIIRPILVQVVFGFFFGGAQPIFRGYEY